MISCIISEELEYNTYVLKTKNETYKLALEFYGLEKPKSGDKMLIHESLLDKKSKIYTQPYAFQLVGVVDLSRIKEENDMEYIILHTNNKNIILKRIYG